LAETLPETVFEMDTTGRLTFANSVGLRMFGYSQKDVEAGLSIAQLLIAEDLVRAVGNIGRFMGGDAAPRSAGDDTGVGEGDRAAAG